MQTWMTSLVVLAFVGSSLAILPHPPWLDKYQYRGTITTGVFNPYAAFMSSAMTVDILMRHGNRAHPGLVVLFSNAHHAEFSQKGVTIDATVIDEGELQWKKFPQLNGPFMTYFRRDSGVVIAVDPSEPPWITNIRKSIMSIIKPPQFLDFDYVDTASNTLRGGPTFSSRVIQPSAYTEVEETFAGICNVSYTITADYKSPLVKDDPYYYRMRRSVDFDTCEGAPTFQRTSHGNYSHVTSNQFADIQTRSLTADYLLHQDANGTWIIDNVYQTGIQCNFPFGMDTGGRLVVHTNQTMERASILGNEPVLSSAAIRQLKTYESVDTWRYQFTSPASPTWYTKKPWIMYQNKTDKYHPIYPEYVVLGYHPITQEKAKARVLSLLSEIANLQQSDIEDFPGPFNGTTDGRLTGLLSLTAKLIRTLETETITQVYEVIRSGTSYTDMLKKQNFWDTMVASGSSAAVKVFVDLAKQDEMDDLQKGRMIMTLVNNLFDPASLDVLMEYVMTIDPSERMILGTLAHLNFAKLTQRVCFNAHIRNYSIPEPFLGVKNCNATIVGMTYYPYVKQKIEKSQSQWEQILFVQTLGSTGHENTIQDLRKITLDVTYATNVRLTAIRAMAENTPGHNKSEQLIAALLPVTESYIELFEVRHAAFIAIMEAHPNETIFQRFAMNSWMEPSDQYRAMVTSTIIALAQSDEYISHRTINIAQKFLPLLKPSNPSFSTSLYFDTRRRIPEFRISTETKIAWLDKFWSRSTPRHAYQSFTANFGGVRVNFAKMFSMLESNHLPFRPGQKNRASSIQSDAHRQMESIADSLGIQMLRNHFEQYIFLGSFNYQAYLPVDNDTMPKIFNELRSMLSSSVNKGPLPLRPECSAMYFNPVDIISILPTAFGLPAIVEMLAPNSWSHGMQYTITSPSISNLEEFDLNKSASTNVTVWGQSKMTMKSQNYVTVMLPYASEDGKSLTTGYDTEASMSVPGKYSAQINNVYPFVITRLEVSPDFREERPILYYRSKPFVVLRKMGPDNDITQETNLMTPSLFGYIENRTMSYRLFGLKAKISFKGDMPYPFQQTNYFSVIKTPEKLVTLLTTPTSKEFALAYRLDIDQSETKNISLAAAYKFGYQKMAVVMKHESDMQYGQRIAQKVSAKMSPEALVELARSGEIGDFLLSLSANYTVPNVRNRQYHAALCGKNMTSLRSSKLDQVTVFNLMRTGVPGEDGERKTCFVNAVSEKIRPTGYGLPVSELYTVLDTGMFAGKQCSQFELMANLKIWMYLNTDERQQPTLPRKLGTTYYPLMPAGRRYDPTMQRGWMDYAVYDKINFQLDRNEQHMPVYLRNMSYWMNDMLRGEFFPYVTMNYDVESGPQSGRTIVNVTRDIPGGTIDAWTHNPEYIARVESLPIHPLFDWSTPFLGGHVTYRHHIQGVSPASRTVQSSTLSANQCSIRSTLVTAFEGVSYSKKPTSCYSVVSQVHHEHDSFSILVRKSQQSEMTQDVKLILANEGATVEILEGHKIMINGIESSTNEAPISSSSGQTIGSVSKSPTHVMITIIRKVSISYDTQAMTVTMNEAYRKLTGGLCGEFNGPSAADMKSPKGCIFAPVMGPEFAASWIVSRSQCRDASVQREILKAQHIEDKECFRVRKQRAEL